jgi:hypothetical protein
MWAPSLHTQDTRTSFPQALVLYRERWLMLGLFCLLTALSGMIWIQFSPIANICEVYFRTSDLAVDSMSTVYMLVYVPGSTPLVGPLRLKQRPLCGRSH